MLYIHNFLLTYKKNINFFERIQNDTNSQNDINLLIQNDTNQQIRIINDTNLLKQNDTNSQNDTTLQMNQQNIIQNDVTR